MENFFWGSCPWFERNAFFRFQDVKIEKSGDDKLGMVVKGGIQGQPGNPVDPTDEGVFISKVNDGGCASKNQELQVGQRIIEVNGQSLLGATHAEAVGALRNAGNSIQVMVWPTFVWSR